MRTHREMPWLWRSLVSVACIVPASACVDAIVGEVEVCEYEGKSHGLNETFPDSDGCNSCKCTIDGEVECTTKECSPVMGCDDKEGCRDAGDAVSDAAVCDPKLGCYDAGVGSGALCKYEGKTYKPGETLRGADGCDECTCDMLGKVYCTDKICYEPDGAVEPGTCEYVFKTYKPGEWFMASDNCNKCECTASGVVECTVGSCTDDAAISDADVGDAGGGPAGYCVVGDKRYRVGEGFPRGDNCNKCTCVSEGFVECSSSSCAPPPGCSIGDQLIQYGKSVTCEDGCNTCTCQMDTKFSRTERACPALPSISKCDAAAGALQFPAALLYQLGDALAVSESRCVNGQTNDFSLCYDDLPLTMGNEATIFAVAGTGTRPCAGTERVYSLVPLRDDYRAIFPGRTGGKITLRGSGKELLYQFGM